MCVPSLVHQPNHNNDKKPQKLLRVLYLGTYSFPSLSLYF